MKCSRSARAFARKVCREKGQSCPKSTAYLVQNREQQFMVQKNAPRSYRKLKQVVFCVDGDRFATRRFGVWVEEADSRDEAWLMQRQLRKAFDDLQRTEWPYIMTALSGVDPEVKSKLDSYLSTARQSLFAEFNRKVFEETKRLMEQDGCFATLDSRGDPLDQAAA